MTYNESTSEGSDWAVGNTASFLPTRLKRKTHRKETSTLLNRYVEEQIVSLKKLYIFRDDEIKQTLKEHPFLIQLLREARNEIEAYFPDTPVLLELATEPEGADTDRLVGFIMTNLDPDTAVDTLHRFDRGWWLNALKQAQGKLRHGSKVLDSLSMHNARTVKQNWSYLNLVLVLRWGSDEFQLVRLP